ncbi:MAG TPA: hypothetical protein VLW50_04415 [Streptosporangiaceae bacterium]|nr:hypothetical protein [Streptosporangiaceae bacterium]
MSARSEQLVLDYLSRAADAAHGILRSDERLRFIANLRGAIEQQRQAVRAVEPAQVRRVLAKFGDPGGLVERERRSLDEAKAADLDAREAGGGLDGTAAPDAPNAGRAGGPPASAPRPRRVAAAGDAGQRVTVPVVRPVEESVLGLSPRGQAGTRAAGPGRPLAREWPESGPPARRTGGGVGRAVSAARRAPAGKRLGTAPTGGTAARVGPQFAFDGMSVVRRFPRELLALVLLGLGGLLFPFPLWIAGVAIGLTSRVWSRMDKLTGLGGPLVITLVTVGFIGVLNKNPTIPVDIHAYVAAAHADALLTLRITAILGAVYLGARLPRGEQPSPAHRSADQRSNRLHGH